MQSRWSDDDARSFCERYASWGDDLALRVYTSRLLGRDTDLVMHGGGNTSVKTAKRDVFGEPVEAICVKGSGWDLDSIEPPGLPALRLGPLRALRRLASLSDEEMVNQQRINLFDASSPNPSVETLLHAFLPHKFVDHTHADAILALTNQPGGAALVREALGDRVAIVPYIMPGFQLAKLAAEIFERDPRVEAMVLLKHGFFSFAENAKASYEAHIAYVDRAERFLEARARARGVGRPSVAGVEAAPGGELERADALAAEIAPVLRGLLAARTGDESRPLRRVILEHRASPEILRLLAEPSCERLAARGPITPDHVIRTKATYLFVPEGAGAGGGELKGRLEGLLGAFRKRYDAYFAAQIAAKGVERKKLDPDPRVVLVPGVGLFAAGKSRKDAAIAADIAEHTLRVKSLAESLGGYEPLPDGDLFDMEYWSLEQAKLGKEAEKPLSRQVALVTGAAGAIGVGICLELAKAGAHVVLTDLDEAALERARARVAKAAGASSCSAVRVDVTDEVSVREGFAHACRVFGGVDVVVPNAGIAHVSSLAATDARAFARVVDVNLTGYFLTMREASRVLCAQGTGGNIVVNASKNVFGPGADFGAYSASKAAGHQLGKVAAIELAPHGIRVNMINADAIFAEGETPSGLWREIGDDRARSKGISPEALEEHYRQRNLLRAKITGAHVGHAVVFFAADLTPTTGATLPVDGGVAAAFPR
jgi:rhamnulose-1-phosphate aldolase/alcohol dehydrogenase